MVWTSSRYVTDVPSVSPTSNPTVTMAPTLPSTAQFYLACGDVNHAGCTAVGGVGGASMQETHEVRCCSDTAKSGWIHNTNFGCNVWGESDLLGVGETTASCHHASTYEEAVAICDANGSRLCTKEEMRKFVLSLL